MRNDHLDEFNNPRTDARGPSDPRDAAIDDALKQALRAEDPGAAFTQRILAKAREERAAQQSGRPLHIAAAHLPRTEASSPASTEVSAQSPHAQSPHVQPPHVRTHTRRLTATRKWIAAIAASLTLAAAGEQWMQHRRYVAEGERARAQVLAALRLTNAKLDIVHDKITEREPAR